jgi:thymidylate kinase
MFSVALIGPDGAGKTTIARMIEKSFPLPVEYLYMGVAVDSSNVALPMTRLVDYLKRRRRKKSGVEPSKNVPPTARKNGAAKRSGKLRAALRLLNRLTEEWYRQFLSWQFRRQGKIVLYDRHYKFDFELDKSTMGGEQRRFTDWLHRWCLANFYPRPDLVVYLDAPAEVLYARKGEFNLAWLESRRQAFISQGSRTPNFVQIDATQPLDAVYAEVTARIMQFSQDRRVSRRAMSVSNCENSVS